MPRYPWILRAFLSIHLILLVGCDSGKPDVVVPVVMKRYAFAPPVIRVKKGQVVELDVSTADVQHGFSVPDLGIKKTVAPENRNDQGKLNPSQ